MNNLTADIGYKSINHYGEPLCGDTVQIVDGVNRSKVIVLADGLKSGVKASILSTLTARIISTMLGEGLSLSECVHAVASTLPISSEYGTAYSTFSIMHIIGSSRARIIQYENPAIIMLRNNEPYKFKCDSIQVADKTLLYSDIALEEGDTFIMMSDGCPGANNELKYNLNWQEPQITEFIQVLSLAGYNAQTLASMLVDECNRLYDGKPIDDTTACVIRIKKRLAANILFGPPCRPSNKHMMFSLFMSKKGLHIACGGTTSQLLAEYLGKDIVRDTRHPKLEGPPMSIIDGIDYVTEGVVTVNRVLENAQKYLENKGELESLSRPRDAADILSRVLFEEVSDVNLLVGMAINPAHHGKDMIIGRQVKVKIAENLKDCLTRMGKEVKLTYY